MKRKAESDIDEESDVGEEEEDTKGGVSVDGKVFCFTGFRDAELEGLIRAAGGQVAASVTKAVTTVVCKTGAEDTKKVKDAEAKGLTIMTKEDTKKVKDAEA